MANPTWNQTFMCRCSRMLVSAVDDTERRLFGWTTLESVYTGAVIAISSTTIIVKAFEEQRVRGRLTDIVFGVLIIEDIIAIFTQRHRREDGAPLYEPMR